MVDAGVSIGLGAYVYKVVQKVRPGHFLPLTSSNQPILKTLSLLERVENVQQESCNTSCHILNMLLDYL